MNKEEKQAMIRKTIQLIYKKKKSDIESRESKDKIESITYYETLELFRNEDGGGVSQQDAYLVRTITNKEKVMYSIYDENQMEIAMVDENGTIKFTESALKKYEQMLTKTDLEKSMLERIKQADGKSRFEEPVKQQGKDISMAKPEIEAQNPKSKDQEEKQPQSKEEELQKIAQKTGMNPNEINNCSTIKPTQKLTDQDTFEDIAGVTGKYTQIYVINANNQTNNNKRYAFYGITKNGKAEYLDNLETTGAIQTDVDIYSINTDGSEVKEKQTSEMFTVKNDPSKSFTVTNGQYGILEVDYVRKDPCENKFMGSIVETEYQRPTTEQVRKFMNERRTNRTELREAIDKTEEQIGGRNSKKEGELKSGKTRLENIDNDKSNDKAIDVDEKITLHNGEVTTLRKQAEKYNMPLQSYVSHFEKAKGDCPSEKIEEIKKEIQEDEERKGKEERETPEEEAIRRLLENT